MAHSPCDDMRGNILDTKTYNLAEQAGMFCDGMEQVLPDFPRFPDADFVFDSDEPYEIYFEWRIGDVSAGLSFMADRDNSCWFVNSVRGDRRTRSRSAMTDLHTADARAFLECLHATLRG